MINIAQYFPITDPTLIFFVVLLIILFAPIIMGKLRIPHIIGMVLAGILVGKYGLNILERDASFELFGKALFPQGFLPAELHHGFQHPDSLPYRFPIRIAAEAERHAECGVQYAFAADSAHHAGGSRRLVLQARRRSLLAFLRRQVCSLLRSHDFPDS